MLLHTDCASLHNVHVHKRVLLFTIGRTRYSDYGQFRQDATVFLVLAVTGLSLGLLEVFIEEVGIGPAHFSFISAKENG